jgi:hypothetical protein
MQISEWIINIFNTKSYSNVEGFRVDYSNSKVIINLFRFVGKEEFLIGSEIFNNKEKAVKFLKKLFGEKYCII